MGSLLKNWVTETLFKKIIYNHNRFQLYVKELSNWNKEYDNLKELNESFNYMLKNWVTETYWRQHLN